MRCHFSFLDLRRFFFLDFGRLHRFNSIHFLAFFLPRRPAASQAEQKRDLRQLVSVKGRPFARPAAPQVDGKNSLKRSPKFFRDLWRVAARSLSPFAATRPSTQQIQRKVPGMRLQKRGVGEKVAMLPLADVSAGQETLGTLTTFSSSDIRDCAALSSLSEIF